MLYEDELSKRSVQQTVFGNTGFMIALTMLILLPQLCQAFSVTFLGLML